MILKFQEVNQEHDAVLSQKQKCLQEIEELTSGMSEELKPHLQAVPQKLMDLEQFAIASERQYIKKIALMNGIRERTLRVIKNDGQFNQGIGRTLGKTCAAREIKVHIVNFNLKT